MQMKAHGDVDAKFHIFAATALGTDRVASPRSVEFTPGKAPVLIFHEAE